MVRLGFADRLRIVWRVLKQSGGSRFAPWEVLSSGWGAESETDSSYLAAYLASPTVYAAINRLAQDLASVPLKIQRRQRNGALVDAPETDEVVRVFRAANPTESDLSFRRRFWHSMKLLGEAFVLTDYLKRPTPQELWVLRAGQAMRIKTTETGLPTSYVYRREGGREIPYDPKEIYHARYPNPVDEFRGAPPIKACIPAINLEIATLKHWTAFFKRGARPSLILAHKDPHKPEIVDEWLRKMKSKVSGPDASFDLMTMDGGWEAKEFGVSPKDGDFPEGYRIVREQILAALGVPPAVAGVLRAGSLSDANVKEQQELYWLNTIVPDLELLARDLTEIVLPRWGDGYVAVNDYTAVPAMEEIQATRATRFVGLIAGGIMSPNEVATEVGLPRVVGGDQRYLTIALTPIGPVQQPAQARSVRTEEKAVDLPERVEHRRKADRDRTHYEKDALREWKGALEAQKDRVLKRFDRGKSWRKQTELPGLDDLWDEEVEIATLRGVILRILGRIVAARGQAATEEVAPGTEFLMTDPTVIRFLESYAAAEVRHVTQTTREAIRNLLKLAVEDGLTLGETQQLLRELTDFSLARALTIARTETTRAYNFSTLEAWGQSEVVAQKEWLTAHDEFVRDSHAEAEAQGPIGLEEQFSNGLAYPGDPAGGPEEVINCRCTLSPTVERSRSVRLAPSLLADLLSRNGNPPEEAVLTAPTYR